jgi:hypothetical protein
VLRNTYWRTNQLILEKEKFKMANCKKKLVSALMLGTAVLAFTACGNKDDAASTTKDGKLIITLGDKRLQT